MSNAEVARELVRVREALSSGALRPEDVGSEFEKLTFLLSAVDPGHDRLLAGLVNDLERVRFTRLSENQIRDMEAVLSKAQDVFNDLA